MSAEQLPFSLLMPVWAGDSAAFFERAFHSSVIGQTRRPDEVVLVQDGPIGVELAAAISDAIEGSPVRVRHLVLESNVGLASALSAGLRVAQHEVIARMDADDVAMPERFERQLPLVEHGYDLVGTGMYEFEHDGVIVGRRVPPVGSHAIASRAKLRDPFNHPTVVYRRAAVERVGGYQDLDLMEDYLLFARMVASGARVANLADALVMYRVDAGAYERRGGWRLFESELRLQRQLLRDGFTTGPQYVRNVLVRGLYRFVPAPIRRVAYRAVFVRDTSPAGLDLHGLRVDRLGDERIAG